MSHARKEKFTPQRNSSKVREQAFATHAELISSLSTEEYKYAMSSVSRFIDPESSTNDNICTFSESGRSSTIFRPKIVQDVNVGPSGLFRVVAHPRFFRPLAMTDFSKNISPLYLGGRQFSLESGVDVTSVVPKGKPSAAHLSMMLPSSQPVPAFEYVDSASKSILLPSWNDEHQIWMYSFSSARDIEWDMTVGVWSVFGSSMLDLWHRDAAGVWSMTAYATSPTSTDAQGLYYHGFGTYTAFGFRLTTFSPVRYVNSICRVVDPVLTPDEEVLHFFDSSISSTVQDAADSFICLGMSAWLQYTGADLVNGGETAGYRYPPDNLTKYSALADTYTQVASTPGALVGKLKQGAWGFYLPQDANELTYQPLETARHLGYILLSGKKNSPDSSIRLNFNQVLLVSTTNQAFSKQIVAANPSGLAAALSILRFADGVIENDGHQEKIRKIKALLKQYAPAIKKGAKTIGQVVKMAAPIVATLL